jgi:hypothetical protein
VRGSEVLKLEERNFVNAKKRRRAIRRKGLLEVGLAAGLHETSTASTKPNREISFISMHFYITNI